MIYILHVYIYSCTQHHAALRERAGVSSPSGLWDPAGLTAVPGRSQARPYRTAGALVCTYIYIYMYMCLYIYIYLGRILGYIPGTGRFNDHEIPEQPTKTKNEKHKQRKNEKRINARISELTPFP